MKKVLVLSSVSRTVLAAIRSLGRAGLEVHTGWTDPDCVSRRSRYLHRAHALPPYAPTDTAWLAALCGLMRRERFDLVMPCTDIDTLACHARRAEIGACGPLYTPNDAAVRVLFDKHATNALAREAGVRLPREIVVDSAAEARGIWRDFGAPLVLKPRRTFDPDRPGAGTAVRKAHSETEFVSLLSALIADGPVAIQQNFIGHGVGVELLLDRGEPLLGFQHVRVHEPLEGGQSCYRKSVALSPELLHAALEILRPLAYTGVAMVEFKHNKATGDWIFVEVNARFWGSLPLSIAAGADFPYALFQFASEGRTQFPQNYRTGLHCRNLTLDLAWQIANFRADRSDPTLATSPLGRVAAETAVNLLTLRERSDTLSLDDPAPGFAEIGGLLLRAGARLRPRRRALGVGPPRIAKSP